MTKKKEEREVEKWITVNGRHVPVYKDASVESSDKIKPSALTVFKENARQMNEALEEATRQRALEVHFTDVTGKTFKRWWDGASWTDKKVSQEMLKRYSSYGKYVGVFKSSFKKPKDWE